MEFPQSSEVQTLKPAYLCRCGATAAFLVHFPGEGPQYLCPMHKEFTPTSKEPEPGRSLVATVRDLRIEPEAPTEQALLKSADPEILALLGEARQLITVLRAQAVEARDTLAAMRSLLGQTASLAELAEEVATDPERTTEREPHVPPAGLVNRGEDQHRVDGQE